MEGNSAKGKYAALIGCTLMLTIVYMSLTSWSVAVSYTHLDVYKRQ